MIILRFSLTSANWTLVDSPLGQFEAPLSPSQLLSVLQSHFHFRIFYDRSRSVSTHMFSFQLFLFSRPFARYERRCKDWLPPSLGAFPKWPDLFYIKLFYDLFLPMVNPWVFCVTSGSMQLGMSRVAAHWRSAISCFSSLLLQNSCFLFTLIGSFLYSLQRKQSFFWMLIQMW